MSSKRRIRRKSCTGKRRFITWEAAIAAIRSLVRARGPQGPLNAYRCQFCNGFHFGHAPGAGRLFPRF
ncbi:hypothetical protein [uncultured Pseudacidovorax sp.]|uniref:hypothetical protein n=1 Tax=uncultured Pseudacidovorax sp. TaxID=679313 RepID=UPI0025E90763|nr:hypothetical protein [uncultured Pseudacidovorax sp.]